MITLVSSPKQHLRKHMQHSVTSCNSIHIWWENVNKKKSFHFGPRILYVPRNFFSLFFIEMGVVAPAARVERVQWKLRSFNWYLGKARFAQLGIFFHTCNLGLKYVKNISSRSLKKYTNWDNLVCLSLYIFWGKCVYFSIFEW